MKKVLCRVLFSMILSMLLWMVGFSQSVGDYRSVASGNWSESATWEFFDGTNWVAATSAPVGAENILISAEHVVKVDVPLSISGNIQVREKGSLEVSTGSLEFTAGAVYEHARDGGNLPIATWGEGSTFLLTGTVQDAPGNRNQDFYHVTFNTPNLGRNRDMGWKDITIGGDVLVISTGANRWQMTSASAGDSAKITIMGDVIVENGQFAVQGTGNANTKFVIHHYGNILVIGGNFSLARGSQGNGSGTTTWYLYQGNLSMSNASIQNSNPTASNAKLVFAKNGTQQLSFEAVTYTGGKIHFEVSDSTTVQILKDMVVNGNLINHGAIEPKGTLTMANGSVYIHARNAGTIPTAIWQEGSTALITGTTNTAPENRGQDYHHLVLNTPNLSSNRDLNLQGKTIGGDITVVNTGTARWQLLGGSSGSVTIRGNVNVQGGQFASQGTSSATQVEIHHYGNIIVTGGNFSISRGTQGGETGSGTTRWFLHEGDFSMSDATTQNSNPWRAAFIFVKQNGEQRLILNNVTFGGGGLPIQVARGASLNLGTTIIGGNGAFLLEDDATLQTALAGGLDEALTTTGNIVLSKKGHFTFNGTEAQIPGTLLPDTLGVLTIANPASMTLNDTLKAEKLSVAREAVLKIDAAGNIAADSAAVEGTVVNKGWLEALTPIAFASSSVYEHARDGGSIPLGNWEKGSILRLTGIVSTAPANRNQNYSNIIFDTPDLTSSRDMGLNRVTINGSIYVKNSGSARWRLTTAAAGDSAIVTIMGNVIVENGSLETHGTSNANTVFIVHHYGDMIVTGGNFSVARGSQGNGSGSTRWFLHEGNFSMSNATTQNSNANNARFVFDKNGMQYIQLENVTYGGGGLAIEVANGTTLDFGISELKGSGLFILNEGATLATAHADGIAGCIQTTGPVSLHQAANYHFNGTTAQVTSFLMPDTVADLLIDNSAGVSLSQITTINGRLRLIKGEFDNTIPFRLGPQGSVSFEGGSLKLLTDVAASSPMIPDAFFVDQNYPNPFNPTTRIRFGLPVASQVTVEVLNLKGQIVARLFEGHKMAGIHELTFKADNLSTGLYFYRIKAGNEQQCKRMLVVK